MVKSALATIAQLSSGEVLVHKCDLASNDHESIAFVLSADFMTEHFMFAIISTEVSSGETELQHIGFVYKTIEDKVIIPALRYWGLDSRVLQNLRGNFFQMSFGCPPGEQISFGNINEEVSMVDMAHPDPFWMMRQANRFFEIFGTELKKP